jgi:hypothetical protein
VCYQLLDVSFKVAQLLTDIHVLVLRVLTAGLWHCFCMALGTAADKALQNFELVSRRITVQHRLTSILRLQLRKAGNTSKNVTCFWS